MSTNVSDSDVEAVSTPGHSRKPRKPRRRKLLLIGTTVVTLVAVTGGVAIATGKVSIENVFGSNDPAPTTSVNDGTSLATVREGSLSTQVNQSGTLSYAGQNDGSPFSVINQMNGIYTWLPNTGDEVKCGGNLYQIADFPVVLLCGTHPAYRTLTVGDEGEDVRQLNNNLLTLGYATTSEIDADSTTFDSDTRTAVKKLQKAIGVDETGILKLGEVVFVPGPLRINSVPAKLGTMARPDTPVLEATSMGRQVTVDLNASQQTNVKVNDVVLITLPNNRTTPGKVTRIGTVATSAKDDAPGASSGSGSATVPVYITMDKPEDAGSLDQAPVQVQITTAGVDKALIVPVTALLGLGGEGYAIERANPDGSREIVPVTLGMFDNAKGLVQVSGPLAPGDRVVVPGT